MMPSTGTHRRGGPWNADLAVSGSASPGFRRNQAIGPIRGRNQTARSQARRWLGSGRSSASGAAGLRRRRYDQVRAWFPQPIAGPAIGSGGKG
ncbi:hypothetical protein NFA_48900 [Nocardia farcinica IFM 10152]|uniref:Uncharacterized protein n=1 Tax=Nocardia farcinica (strain IFM 10152) TaxID=247156 RepID=Q5YPZ9_NOCFA|nr:hypothetical protein NFA_48900 [Nocardia farcinica IFM 10152]